MDAFSSSFLPAVAIASPKSLIFPSSLSSSSSHVAHQLNVSSVRIEEKPTTQTQKPSTQKTISPSSKPPTKISSSSPATRRRAEATIPAIMLNACDNIINSFIDPPLKPSVDPKHVLSDNFAPVDELPPTQCDVVQGSLPPCLDGAYIRNGPNPQYLPRGPYHLFDGDGMLHSIKISKGRAFLRSRYERAHLLFFFFKKKKKVMG